MAGRREKIKIWFKKIWPFLINACKVLGFMLLLLVVIAIPVAGGIFLLSMDKHHECYREFLIEHYFIRNNYYDGEIWLSVAATLVGAVISATPGLMCGILALWQTNRLHKLEARYHRPGIEIEGVEIHFVRIRPVGNGKNESQMNDLNKRQRDCVDEADKCESDWWIDLRIDLLSNSGIAIKGMEIDSVTLMFLDAGDDKRYELILTQARDSAEVRIFSRDMRDGHAVYTLNWSLFPFKKLEQKQKEGFEESIRRFAYYSEVGKPKYSRLELSANMSLDYEYKEEKQTRCLLRVVFDSEQSKPLEQSAVITKYRSANGYFTYEV